MDQRTFERKVTELAEKLKKNGVATSDTMARSLAEDIIKTEQTTKSDDLPEAEQEDSKPQGSPKNLVVEEAIKNAQGASHTARVDDDVDQDKSIAELLEEDASKNEQPEVTLDKPVVEGGVAREEKESSGFIPQQKPNPQPTTETPAQEPQQHQGTTQQEQPAPQPETPKQEVPEQQPQQKDTKPEEASEPEPQKQENEETKSEPRPEEKVDLSEMFNFSKK